MWETPKIRNERETCRCMMISPPGQLHVEASRRSIDRPLQLRDTHVEFPGRFALLAIKPNKCHQKQTEGKIHRPHSIITRMQAFSYLNCGRQRCTVHALHGGGRFFWKRKSHLSWMRATKDRRSNNRESTFSQSVSYVHALWLPFLVCGSRFSSAALGAASGRHGYVVVVVSEFYTR